MLVLVAPAAADLNEKKRDVDARLARLNEQLAKARQKEGVLRQQIAGVSGQIRALERRVGDVSERLEPLERELILRELKLNRLNVLFELQTRRLGLLRQDYSAALWRLNQRIVAIYESETPDTLTVVLAARSFTDFLDAFDYARQIGDQDRSIADTVGRAKQSVAAQLEHTRVARQHVLQESRVIAVRVHQVRVLRDRLAASRDRLAAVRDHKRISLDQLKGEER